MSRPEAEVQAEIRLNAMLAELEERQQQTGEMPTDEEIMQIRADQAILGKTEEQEAVAAFQEEQIERYGPYPEREEPENPYARWSQPASDQVNPYEQFAAQPDAEMEVEPPMPELTPFPEEKGTSRAAIQLPEMASLQSGTSMFLPETNFNVSVDTEMLDAMGGFEGLANASAYSGAPMMPPLKVEGMGELAGNLGMTAAMMTMTDPQEIADTLTQQVEYEDPNTGEIKTTPMFPGVTQMVAPDGTLIMVNNRRKDPRTGQPHMALINRPGLSMMDVVNMIGIGTAYTPAGRYSAVASQATRRAAQEAASETAQRLAIREARKKGATTMMGGSAVTETVLQKLQQEAGGTFDPGEVAFATAFGAVPDYVFDPLLRTATKIPSYLTGKIPEREAAELAGKTAAMQFAEDTGRRVMTQDVLQERITPPMAIFAKIVERIPLVGTGRARRRMQQERLDALTELAKNNNIDVTSNYGTQVMEAFVERMNNQRFWGRNQEIMEKIPHYPPHARRQALARAEEMLQRAWEREAGDLTEGVLKRAIVKGDLDDTILDQVMNSNRPVLLTELFERLTPAGQQAAKNRFFLRGLEEATWTPDAPGVADPAKFMKFLDAPKNRKIIEAWFSPEEQQMLKGMREYLRLTAAADKTAAGAGMVAAVGGGGSFLAGLLDAFVGVSAITATAGHAYQSQMVRNRLLQLAHTGANERMVADIVAELRPYMVAAEKQWAGDNYQFPEVSISRESAKEAAADVGEYLVERGQEAIGDIGQIPQNIYDFIQDKD